MNHLFHCLQVKWSLYLRGRESNEYIAIARECQQNYGHLLLFLKKIIFLNFMNFFNVRKRNQNYVIFLDDKSPKFYGNYIISEL